MRTWMLAAVLNGLLVSSAEAQTPKLDTALAGAAFLVGNWTSSDGKVSDTGSTSKGTSVITIEAGGHAFLRRDHTELFDKTGKTSGGFDQIMLIYPEKGAIHADYSDGSHIIHYDSAAVVAGRSVTFTSVQSPGAPTFRLIYELTAPRVLAVTFGMVPPGQTEVHPIASGTLSKFD